MVSPRFSGALVVVATIMLSSMPSAGQTIPIRTVPVASGDQFLLLPSKSMGMGGVRLAVDDSLSDPWSNPAKGVFLTESAFIASPAFYSISQQGGGGRSLPVAGMFAGERLFGGGAVALQQVENQDLEGCCFFTEPTAPRRLGDAFSRNLYVTGFLGTRLGSGPWSVGAAFSAAELNALDGVDLLYAGADRIEQSGSIQNLRLGLYRSGTRDRVSLVLLHDRVSMSHEVSFVEWIWAASPAPDVWLQPQPRTRVELNEDRTRTWGGHIAWDRALEQAGWRVGASATVNRKAHPKIPNYSIQNIPRDPGITWAYEAALGVARSLGGTTVGLDIAVQPIWSETWQEADIWTAEASGGRFRVGDRTIENDFFFTNVFMRAGFSHEVEGAAVQVGVEARSYDYSLDQADHLQRSFRRQDESWIEWTPTFGMVFSVSDLELRYSGRVTTGTGRPGVAQERGLFLEAASGGSPGDFILAPGGPLTLQDVRVVTHQLSVRIPVR